MQAGYPDFAAGTGCSTCASDVVSCRVIRDIGADSLRKMETGRQSGKLCLSTYWIRSNEQNPRYGKPVNLARQLRIAYRRLGLHPRLTKVYDRVNEYFSGAPTLGDRGERAAERFLLRKGWIIVDRGLEGRSGEIDLIAVDGQTVVFVEVKTRTSDLKGHPSEAVDESKQRKICLTAYAFLKKKQLTECAVRFDVISVLWPDLNQPPNIEHFPNAFEPSEQFQLV